MELLFNMPVIKWDHVEDPLDVDKKKVKKSLAKDANQAHNPGTNQIIAREDPNLNQLQL